MKTAPGKVCPVRSVIEKIKRIALGLAELGVKEGDKVAIISENRPEWSITDLAILSLKAVNVPIYTTQAVEQIRYILEDSGSKMLFVSGTRLWKHAEQAVQSVERLEKIVFFDEDAVPEQDGRAISLKHVEELGDAAEKIDSEAFQRYVDSVGPDDLATIIYTSGTTGEPKGALLTHRNFVSNINRRFQELFRFVRQTVRLRSCRFHIFLNGRFFMSSVRMVSR